MKQRIITAFFAILIIACKVSAQQTSVVITADSLASGNNKEVFKSFFQLAFNRLTGPDKEISFTSNPFAVMARANPQMLVDEYYMAHKRLRKLNFSFSVKLDSSYNFNGFSSGIKYALVNKRDETISENFLKIVATNEKTEEFSALNLALNGFISNFPLSPVDSQKIIRNQITEFIRGKINFNQLDTAVQSKIKDIAKYLPLKKIADSIHANSAYNILEDRQNVYKKLKESFNNKVLWTIGISDTTYKDQFIFSNIILASELVKGIDGAKKNDIEINAKTKLQFIDDTLKAKSDLKRCVFSLEAGFNFVLKAKDADQGFFEIKLTGGYDHVFSSLYTNEERSRFSLNSTLRLRILKDFWIPLEIKYDPDLKRFSGALNFKANFSAISNFAQSFK